MGQAINGPAALMYSMERRNHQGGEVEDWGQTKESPNARRHEPSNTLTPPHVRLVGYAPTGADCTHPGSIPSLSLTASVNRCLQPMYRSVVCTET